MNASSPNDFSDPTDAPDPASLARTVAREHAACLTSVARERAWLLDALARGKDITELAIDLNVTPRAIRHLLGH